MEIVDYEKYNVKCSYGLENLKRLHDVLFEMLVWLDDLFNKNNITYFLNYGTLLGAIRHQNFIPWDDDLDICIMQNNYEKALALIEKNVPSNYQLGNKKNDPNYFLNFSRLYYKPSETYNKAYPSLNVLTHKGIYIDLFRCWEDRRSIFSITHRRFFNELIITRSAIKTGKWNTKFFATLSLFYKTPLVIGGFILDKIASKQDAYTTDPVAQTVPMWKKELFPLKRLMFNGKLFPVPKEYDTFLKRHYGDYMKIPDCEHRFTHYNQVKFSDQ